MDSRKHLGVLDRRTHNDTRVVSEFRVPSSPRTSTRPEDLERMNRNSESWSYEPGHPEARNSCEPSQHQTRAGPYPHQCLHRFENTLQMQKPKAGGQSRRISFSCLPTTEKLAHKKSKTHWNFRSFYSSITAQNYRVLSRPLSVWYTNCLSLLRNPVFGST